MKKKPPIETIPYTLLQAYRKTTFIADTPRGRLTILIGQRCPELDKLLTDHRASTWAYVTASNPGSVQLSEDENAARHREFAVVAARLGVASYAGQGIGDDRRWPAEPSLLILGITRGDAVRLGQRYGQIAIVCGEAGGEAELELCRRQ